ncbi:MAG: hypothetical protein PHD43_00320 [Methylococcales bacterium]|nr:hypothetical protein [Methylococcales bacterium]
MISSTYRKILYGLALLGFISIVIMPDVVMGLLFELVHLFFELLFISFEWIESTLDTLVEHLFHTDLHQTQAIVFYLLLGMILYVAYNLWRVLSSLFSRLTNNMLTAWTEQKTRASIYWQELSLIKKTILFSFIAGSLYLASFLFF